MGSKQEMNQELLKKKQELLEKIRVAKEAKGLSNQDVVNLTQKNGEAVSPSTVQRVLKKGANAADFRYGTTLRPIARAVLGMDEELEAPEEEITQEQAEILYTTVEGLKAVIDFKHEQIMSLQKENEYLKGIVADYKSEIKWHRQIVSILGAVAVLSIIATIVAVF